MSKHYITPALRELEGQFAKVTERAMIQARIERMGHCEACGKAIKNHCGVQSPDGSLMWVGIECESVLTAPDAPILSESALSAGQTKVERLAIPWSAVLFAIPFLWQPTLYKGEIQSRGFEFPSNRKPEREAIRAMENRGWATQREIETIHALLAEHDLLTLVSD